jgi:hypothetical protein
MIESVEYSCWASKIMPLLLVAASSILTEGIVYAYDRPRQPKDGCVEARRESLGISEIILDQSIPESSIEPGRTCIVAEQSSASCVLAVRDFG